MKNGLFTITLIENDHGPSTVNQLKPVWWDWKGVVYFELLPRNQTINSDVYCQQLDKLDAAIKVKWPELINRKGVIFHHDNARPHTSLAGKF